MIMIATTTAARGYGKFAHRQSISCLILFSPRRSGGEVTFASRRDVDIPIASIVSSRGGGYYDDNDDWMIVSKYLVYGNVDLPRREHWKRHDVYQIDLCDATSVVMCSCGWEDRVSRGRRRDIVHDDDDDCGYYPSIHCAVCRGNCWYVATVNLQVSEVASIVSRMKDPNSKSLVKLKCLVRMEIECFPCLKK